MTRFTARLSTVDQAKPVMHQTLFYSFPSQDPEKTVESLLKGIQKTAHQYPYLTGIISRGEDQGYTTISWSDSDGDIAVERKHVKGLPTYAELRAKGMPLHQLTEDLRPSGTCGNPKPNSDLRAFLSSYTLVDGGVILCLAFHHHLVDGIAIGQILAVIADNTAGRTPGKQHDPQAILHRYENVTAALGLTKASTSEVPPQLISSAAAGHPAPPRKEVEISDLTPRIFTFSVQQLDVLRDRFAAQFHVPRPSSVVLLSCLLWVAISGVRSRHQSSEKEITTFILALNSRVAFPPTSFFNSDNFVGNLSGVATVTKPLRLISRNDTEIDHEKIVSALAGPIQWLVQSLTKAQKVDTIKSSYQTALDTPDARKLGGGAFQMPPNSVMLTSYANFPWYFDFGPGVGKVDFGRFATAHGEGFDGASVLLPRKREEVAEDEVIEAFLKLNREDMAAVEEHPWLKAFFAKAPF